MKICMMVKRKNYSRVLSLVSLTWSTGSLVGLIIPQLFFLFLSSHLPVPIALSTRFSTQSGESG